MRRLAIVFAVLLLILQPRAANAPRGLIGLLGEARGTPSSTKHVTATPPAKAQPTLAIAGVFAARPPSLAKYDSRKLITILSTGNVSAARTVNYEMTIHNDFKYPFLKTAKFLHAADLTLVDLESPLCPVSEATQTYCGDPRFVGGLSLAGVDMAALPDNQVGGFPASAVRETEQHLTDAGIAWTGLAHTVYKKVKGVVFAFLSFNAAGQVLNTSEMGREIRGAHKRAAVVVVSFRWGNANAAAPTPAQGKGSQDPKAIAHLAVQDGANLVIGNYPHQIQGVEIYNGTFISYASGNFVYDQVQSALTSEGVIGTYTFYGTHLVSVRFRPVRIENFAQPVFMPAAQVAPILARMEKATSQIVGGFTTPVPTAHATTRPASTGIKPATHTTTH
jgi:hypothetical protein